MHPDPAATSVPVPVSLLLDERLSDAAKVLWAVLRQIDLTGSSEGAEFEMTAEHLCELTGASKPSVLKRRDELVAAGLLEVTTLRGLGRANLYRVRLPGQAVPQQAQ